MTDTTTTNTDTYEGWANRETCALNLWLNNDEGLYIATQKIADDATNEYVTDCDNDGLKPTNADRALVIGEAIVQWVREFCWDAMDVTEYQTMRDDVGSLWRVDKAELGAAWVDDDDDQDWEGSRK